MDKQGRCGVTVQVQNIAKNRVPVDVAESLAEYIKTGNVEKVVAKADLTDVLTTLVRGVICAEPGNSLIALDYSSIEARVLAWLVDERELLELFASGTDPYVAMAARIYDKPRELVTKKERAFGKVVILGLGYGMGLDKFVETCINWGLDVDVETITKAFNLYRNRYKRIVSFWYDFDRQITNVIKTGKTVRFSGLTIEYDKKLRRLTIVLPNGRPLRYWKCRIEDGSIRYWGKYQNKWCDVYSWGGKFTENVVQAMSRDLLAIAMIEMDKRGIDIRLTVHDEIVIHTKKETAQKTYDAAAAIMCTAPTWANGLPIEVDGWIAERYRKD